jgi:hypothetical protein
MSNTKHTYAEIANDRRLWTEYADPLERDTAEQFAEWSEAEKIKILVDCFGNEDDLDLFEEHGAAGLAGHRLWIERIVHGVRNVHVSRE